MRICAIVPYKARKIKSRLSPILTYSERRTLSQKLLSRVIDAVSGEIGSKNVYVVTSSKAIASYALKCGVNVIREERDKGVNEAVRRAISELSSYDSYVIVPSDLPFLTRDDIRNIARLSNDFVVIAPSLKFDGTNILSFRKDRNIELSYDMNSFWNHLASAAAKGLRVYVYARRTVLVDVDTPSDLSKLRKRRLNNELTKYLETVWKKEK